MREFNNIEEMKEFYNEETNEFKVDESIKINFNIDCSWDINAWDINAWDIKARDIKARDINAWDIKAWDIKARDINAWDINAWDIKAWDIKARDINFYEVCVAYNSFRCKSIQGAKKNSKYFCLNSDVEIKGENNDIRIQ